MVEASPEVATGGDPDGDIGGELAVAAPVVMAALHDLLGGGPDVVGELGAFHHHTDLVVEP